MSDLNVTAKQAFAKIQKHEADTAIRAKKEGVELTDTKGVIEKDSLSVAPGLEKKSSDELNKLYETFNTDGADGLNETEFESLFSSVMAEGAKETAAAGQTQATIEKNGETKTVTVKPGDTLSKIARENGVTLNQLKEANPNLFKDGKDSGGKTRSAGGNLIYPGDQVQIPQKPSPTASDKTSETEKTEKKDKAEETKKPEETGKTEKQDKPKESEKAKDSEKTQETDKTKETEKADETPAQQEIKKAKETIDGAKIEEITPEALETMTLDDLAAIQVKDSKTVEEAKAALPAIPTDDPQRAEYEGKVQELETEYKTQYGVSEEPEEIVVDEGIDDNEARRMVSSRKPEELDQLNVGTRIGLIKAMDRGATSVAEDQAIGQVAQSIARTHPEALSPEVVAHMDDNGIREFIKGSAEGDLDKLPTATRGAMIKGLAEGNTSNEEDKMIGQLAASMAKTHPEALTADTVRMMDDNGVRAMMDHVDGEGLAKLPADTRKAMIQELVDGHTSDEEDKLIGRLGASLAATHPESLTPDLVRSMDDNGVRAMTQDMSVADLSKLPRAVLEAMRQELRAGWTTENEYQQIDKITQALPNAK
ncbi:LysM domain protein [compost metagenome]